MNDMPVREPRVSAFLISALVLLVPVVMIPIAAVPFIFSKVFLAGVIGLVLLALFVIRVLRQGAVSVVWSSLFAALLVLPFTYLIAACFSAHPTLSFWGYQLEGDTFGFIALGSTLACLIACILPRSRVFAPLIALLGAAWVVFIFQLVQVLARAPLPFAILKDSTFNVVGGWNDLIIFAGLITVALLFVAESLILSLTERLVVWVTLAAALFFLILGGLMEVWIVVALVAFVLIVHAFVRAYGAANESAPRAHGVTPGIVLVIALFFILTGALAGSKETSPATTLATFFHVTTLDVRPSFRGTLTILSAVYAHSPFVGSGPNTFAPTWLLYRPLSVESTPYWGTPFTNGSGTIPTAAAVGGAVVALGWLLFLLALGWTSARALLVLPPRGDRLYFVTAAVALSTVYLALMHVLYAPASSLTLLMFIMVGLFLASLKETSLIATGTISFRTSPRVGFVIVLALLIMLLVGATGVYGMGRMYLALVTYQRARSAADAGDLTRASTQITNALALMKSDLFYRTATTIDLAKMNLILTAGKSDTVAQNEFKIDLTAAVADSGAALAIDPLRFENLIVRESVYAAVIPLKIQGAYENALAALDAAALRSPTAPEVNLLRAQAAVMHGDTALARTAIAATLAKKADYTDAILLLAQIELNAGDIGKAITAVKNAVYFEPTNPTLLYQLGVLLLSDKQYQDAATVFEAALQAQPDFQNATFFLGETYAFLGRYDDATRLMAELVSKNADNTTLVGYRDALAGGKNPFTTVVAPDQKPSIKKK